MKSCHSKCTFALSTCTSEINLNDQTYSASLHRRFLTSHVVLYCMKSGGITDGRPEGRIAPPDKLDVKTELPLSSNFDCNVLLVSSRLLYAFL